MKTGSYVRLGELNPSNKQVQTMQPFLTFQPSLTASFNEIFGKTQDFLPFELDQFA